MAIKKIYKLIIISLLFPIIISCDAICILTYKVKNNSNSTVILFVPNFPLDSSKLEYGLNKDTLIQLSSKEKIVVGHKQKLDFPWGTKNVYKLNPGKCGLKIITNDSSSILGCSKNEWAYWKKSSIYKIK